MPAIEGTLNAIHDGVKKMPEPMTDPTTTHKAASGPRVFGNAFDAGASAS
jgi:hypothetical protein